MGRVAVGVEAVLKADGHHLAAEKRPLGCFNSGGRRETQLSRGGPPFLQPMLEFMLRSPDPKHWTGCAAPEYPPELCSSDI